MAIIIVDHNIILEDEANKHWGKVPDVEDLELNEEETKIYEQKVKNEFSYTELEDINEMIKACIYDSEYHKIVDNRNDLIQILTDNFGQDYDELVKLSDYELIELVRTETEIEITFHYDEKSVFFNEPLDLAYSELSKLNAVVDSINLRDFASEENLTYYNIECEFPSRALKAKWTQEGFDTESEYKIELLKK